ncbi:hypothetical protein AZE42_09536 [Rhizopogon vesiculosus]|uniref:Uncharacterized protein n=1 Tax=Rhizopogon vesiculosus TaxID=180088 RepID=A0A1J8PKW3_9AGAM|nr:hypothetical protein AZE42_09536 [Rhizopogon vesiculosus]
MSSVMLNIEVMLGAGIYSVPGVVLNSVGSIGLLFYFPKEVWGGSILGADISRPRFLVPVTFAVTSVLLEHIALYLRNMRLQSHYSRKAKRYFSSGLHYCYGRRWPVDEMVF